MPIARRAAIAALSALVLSALPHAQARAELVRIGVSGPLSGPNAFAGKDNENGVRLAIEELNAKGVTDRALQRYIIQGVATSGLKG